MNQSHEKKLFTHPRWNDTTIPKTVGKGKPWTKESQLETLEFALEMIVDRERFDGISEEEIIEMTKDLREEITSLKEEFERNPDARKEIYYSSES